MRIFVAGSTGVVGRTLVPLLLKNGHDVVALVRSAGKVREVEAMGAKAAVADALDKEGLTTAIRKAEPEGILNELTSLAGAGDFKRGPGSRLRASP